MRKLVKSYIISIVMYNLVNNYELHLKFFGIITRFNNFFLPPSQHNVFKFVLEKDVLILRVTLNKQLLFIPWFIFVCCVLPRYSQHLYSVSITRELVLYLYVSRVLLQYYYFSLPIFRKFPPSSSYSSVNQNVSLILHTKLLSTFPSHSTISLSLNPSISRDFLLHVIPLFLHHLTLKCEFL